MAKYKGTLETGIQPVGFTGSQLENMSYNWRANYVKSANTQLRYQIMWSGLQESQSPSKTGFNSNTQKGEIINMVFRIYATTQYPYPVSTDNWDLVATIRKTRDIANREYNTNNVLSKQRFTIDISQLCQDLLSYSLVPIGKGTWQSSEWGGMNGGQTKNDNVTETVSKYNVTPNGSYRHILVEAIPEVILANGTIKEVVGQNPIKFNKISVINSVAQFEKDAIYYVVKYIIRKYGASTNYPRGFLSFCPNYTQTSNTSFLKQVREDEEAEWLYWWQRDMGDTGDQTEKARLKVETYLSNGSAQNTMYLTDFNSNLDTEVVSGPTTVFKLNQHRVCVQNVSPTYINANAVNDSGSTIINQIDSSTSYYKIHLEYTSQTSTVIRATEFRYFGIDRETANIPFGFVRFHWLNRIGGIDSYTAKRDVMEGLSVSRDTIETKSADRTWYQDNQFGNQNSVLDSDYISNTMRGGNLYKGGREVLNVNAQKNNSVYTEPLNKQTADWLVEIMTSPNVWIEMDTDATARGNTVNPYQRPSTKEYIPVIITNSDVETVNQEAGLVKFNIEYTLSHKVQTQRN